MLLSEKNSGRKIRGECVIVMYEDRIRFIARDTGVQFDVTDPDIKESSLRSYAVSGIAERISPERRHLSAVSFNRSVFEIRDCKKQK